MDGTRPIEIHDDSGQTGILPGFVTMEGGTMSISTFLLVVLHRYQPHEILHGECDPGTAMTFHFGDGNKGIHFLEQAVKKSGFDR